jgi:FkbM family methyltransferase
MPLYLLNHLRLFTNKVLAPVGFAVERVRKTNPWGSPLVSTKIGKFTIRVPRINPVTVTYLDYPDTMSQLAPLVLLMKKKYPNLSAIDIGANVGDTACLIKTGGDIPLVCIEGDDSTYELLRQNMSQWKNTSAHKLFLGEKTGNVAATFERSGWNTTIKPGHSSGSQNIEITSLDDFMCAQQAAANCKLVKIDAEGFDCSIIRGAMKFLQQVRPVVMFEYNRDNMDTIGEKGLETLRMLCDLGYSKVAFHDCYGRFFTDAALSEDGLVQDLLDYADGKHPGIYYFDLTVFHKDDSEVALEFVKGERTRRNNVH